MSSDLRSPIRENPVYKVSGFSSSLNTPKLWSFTRGDGYTSVQTSHVPVFSRVLSRNRDDSLGFLLNRLRGR